MSLKTICYISHGGGPLPLLNDQSHGEMIEVLHKIVSKIGRPSSIIVVSAHWEEQVPTITSGLSPELIYDYYGFPEEAYQIKYQATGNPNLAGDVLQALLKNGVMASLDKDRGFDHGLFVPLKIMYPEGGIPCLQLSLVNNLDPLRHIKIGQALSALGQQNLLLLGSGFSFHNLRLFFSPSSPEIRRNNSSFENWLIETCMDKKIPESARMNRLLNWEKAPAARFCHPREEHLLPLHVCYGAAGAPAREVFSLEIMGKKSSAYLWQ